MKYYESIPLANLEIIQEKVFNLFPKEKLDTKKDSLFYMPDNVNIFMNIPELRQELNRLGWTPYVFAFALYIVPPTKGSTIHIDSGYPIHSFNVPILNCNNTFVNFYTTTEQPVMQTYVEYDRKINYFKYNPDKCVLIDKLELITPHVIKVKEVHNITNLNTGPRITLLIRLKKELNLDHLFV